MLNMKYAAFSRIGALVFLGCWKFLWVHSVVTEVRKHSDECWNVSDLPSVYHRSDRCDPRFLSV